MNTPTEGGEVLRIMPPGRVDGEQQAVIKLDVVRERLQELERLYLAGEVAREQFSDAIKAAAESSGMLAKPLRNFIAARMKDKIPDKKRECEQLQLLFDEVD